MLVDGKWIENWQPVQKADEQGRFVRQVSSFRNWITADGRPGPTGEGGFQADDAIGCIIKLHVFFVICMRGMIGRNDIDGAILHAFDEGQTVFLGAQRRIHLEICVVGRERFIGQPHMMRHRFGGDVDFALFRPTDQLNRILRRDVLHVDMRPRISRKNDVTRDDQIFGRIGPTL